MDPSTWWLCKNQFRWSNIQWHKQDRPRRSYSGQLWLGVGFTVRVDSTSFLFEPGRSSGSGESSFLCYTTWLLKVHLRRRFKLIKKALQSEEDSLAPFGHIMEAAKITIDVTRISFIDVHRLGNVVVHNLAKHALHVAGLQVWMEDVPPHLFSILLSDHGWFSLIKFKSWF